MNCASKNEVLTVFFLVLFTPEVTHYRLLSPIDFVNQTNQSTVFMHPNHRAHILLMLLNL